MEPRVPALSRVLRGGPGRGLGSRSVAGKSSSRSVCLPRPGPANQRPGLPCSGGRGVSGEECRTRSVRGDCEQLTLLPSGPSSLVRSTRHVRLRPPISPAESAPAAAGTEPHGPARGRGSPPPGCWAPSNPRYGSGAPYPFSTFHPRSRRRRRGLCAPHPRRPRAVPGRGSPGGERASPGRGSHKKSSMLSAKSEPKANPLPASGWRGPGG